MAFFTDKNKKKSIEKGLLKPETVSSSNKSISNGLSLKELNTFKVGSALTDSAAKPFPSSVSNGAIGTSGPGLAKGQLGLTGTGFKSEFQNPDGSLKPGIVIGPNGQTIDTRDVNGNLPGSPEEDEAANSSLPTAEDIYYYNVRNDLTLGDKGFLNYGDTIPGTFKDEKDEAEGLFGFQQFTGPQALADKYGLGESKFGGKLFSSTLEEEIAKQKKAQEDQQQFLTTQQAFQREIEQQQFKDLQRSGASQAAGVEATLAPGREGFIGGTAAQGIQQFKNLISEKINIASGKLAVAEGQREQQMKQLKEAQDSGNQQLVKSIQQGIAGAEQTIRQEKENLLNAQFQANQQTLALQDQMLQNTTAKLETLESMGSSIAGLTTSQLSSIIQGTNLTMPEVLTLQKAIELEGLAANTKNEQEAEVLKLQAEQLRADIAEIGKIKPTAAIQNFEFFQALQDGGYSAEQILEFQRLSGTAPGQLDATEQAELAEYYNEISNSPGISGSSKDIADKVLNSTITQSYSPSSKHYGLDYVLTGGKGADVQSTVTGTIKEIRTGGVNRDSNSNGGWGNTIVIDIGGETHRFAHLDSINPGLSVGQVIPAGSILGKQGNTGRVEGQTGIHVHYQITGSDGKTKDPKAFLAGIKETESGSVAGGYSDQQLRILANLSGSKPTAGVIQSLKDAGLTTTDLFGFDPSTAPLPSDKVAEFQEIIATIEALKIDPGLPISVGSNFFFGNVPGTKGANFVAEFTTFKDRLAIPNLEKLKGAMSDKDLEFLKNTATSLKRTMTEERFLEKLDELQLKYEEILRKKGNIANQEKSDSTGTPYLNKYEAYLNLGDNIVDVDDSSLAEWYSQFSN